MTPVQPGEMATYKDLVYRFSFKAPKAWTVESVRARRLLIIPRHRQKHDFKNLPKAISARASRLAQWSIHPKKKAAAFKQSMENIKFTGPQPTTLGGEPALKVAYSISGDEDGLTGYRIFADKDSLVTYFDAATFGAKRLAKYKPVFDLSSNRCNLRSCLRSQAERSIVPA